jgi:hypothetical protein
VTVADAASDWDVSRLPADPAVNVGAYCRDIMRYLKVKDWDVV